MSKIPLTTEQNQALQAYGEAARKEREANNTQGVEDIYLACWNLIPDPKLDHDHAQSIVGVLVRFYRDSKQLEKASQWLPVLREAYSHPPSPAADLYVGFIEATVYYHSGDLDAAFKIFDSQFKQFNARPFQGEDPEYLNFYKMEAERRKAAGKNG